MRKKQDLIALIGNGTYGDPPRDAARAELDAVLAEEHTALMQQTRENVFDALASLGSEIVKLRDGIKDASADASRLSKWLVGLTAVLAFATIALAAATALLVSATLKLAAIPH